jgi:DNA-directed RNA polymerase subunit H (RpoH/RPB5)
METDLFQIEYDEVQKKHVILTNWIKMLFNRNWITDNLNTLIKNISVDENNEAYIKTPNKVYVLKMLFRKVSTIRNDDEIADFLKRNHNMYCFFVVHQMASKAQKQLLENNEVEVFGDEELMENIIENIFVPTHIVLTEEEANKYKEEYRLKNTDIQRIFTTDPIAKYYNIKPGQLVKIIRPSITSGEEIAFRLCVPGQII